jgi:hypothetical protein
MSYMRKLGRKVSFVCVVALAASASIVTVAGASAAANNAPTTMTSPCSIDGSGCRVGATGPGGGIVYYDAGSPQWWGQFLEATTSSTPARGPWSGQLVRATQGNPTDSKAIGMGSINSLAMEALDPQSVYARHKATFFKDVFFLPSKDELDALYNYWKLSGGNRLNYPAAPMWTSSEASESFAWYQLFQDGTQFTDANGIIRGLKKNKNYELSPIHVGSAFQPAAFQVIGVRAFGPKSGGINVSWNGSATLVNPSCSNAATPVCRVGDIGPGGGIVFYDAGKTESWGRYLEIAPQSCEGVRLPWRPASKTNRVYETSGFAVTRLKTKFIGMGRLNTQEIVAAFGANSYAAKFADDLVCGGKDDWFLPAKDELDIAFNRLAQNRVGGNDTPVGGFNKGYYWTSSIYDFKTAWTQYFMDGQQFDREQTLDGNKTPPTPFRVRAVRAFG